MSSTSPRYGIAYMATSSINKETIFNEAVAKLDILTNPVAKSLTTTAPPGSPALGDTYIIPAGATGAWAGEGDNLVYWANGWVFLTPPLGILVWVEDQDEYYTYDGTSGGWSQYALATNSLNDLSDVDTASAAQGTYLAYDASLGQYVTATDPDVTVYEESDGTLTVRGGAVAVFDQYGTNNVAVVEHARQINFAGEGVRVFEGTDPWRARVQIDGLTVFEDGAQVQAGVSELNFVGTGVSVSEFSDGQVEVTITGGSGSGGGQDISVEDDGVQVLDGIRGLNFTGAGVSAHGNSDGIVDVNISGGGGGGGGGSDIAVEKDGTQVLDAIRSLNFIGPVSVSDTSDGTVDVTVGALSIRYSGASIINLDDADFSGNRIVIANGGANQTFNVEGNVQNRQPCMIVHLNETGGGVVVDVTAESGVDLRSVDDANRLRKLNSTATIIPLGADDFLMVGDIIP